MMNISGRDRLALRADLEPLLTLSASNRLRVSELQLLLRGQSVQHEVIQSQTKKKSLVCQIKENLQQSLSF